MVKPIRSEKALLSEKSFIDGRGLTRFANIVILLILSQITVVPATFEIEIFRLHDVVE